jgi:hypothetical protein
MISLVGVTFSGAVWPESPRANSEPKLIRD